MGSFLQNLIGYTPAKDLPGPKTGGAGYDVLRGI
jgi:hypothetical protein